MKALVIGATGATGKDLVDVLLASEAYSRIVIFVRRATGLAHPKLQEVITDFDQLEQVAEYINGDVWFSCLGTTLKIAGTKENQWHIDHDIPLAFANIAKRNGVRSAVLLSAYGARPTSNVFYSKMKGQLETGIEQLHFDQYIIFRPGLLQRKNTDRSGERIMLAVLHFFDRLGLFRKYRPMPTNVLARKMASAPQTFPPGKHMIELDKIFTTA